MTLIFAHRGWSGRYPENTLSAFDHLKETKADGIEMDVQLTKDQEVVVFHDDRLDRLTSYSGEVSDYSLDELTQIKVFDQEPILSFDAFLDWSLNEGERYLINVELKSKDESDLTLADKVIQAIDRFQIEKSRIIISSFNWDLILRVQTLDPSIALAFLLPKEFDFELEDLFSKMKAHQIKYIHPSYELLNDDFFTLAERYGFLINTWTVNDFSNIDSFLAYNLFGIITNHPDQLETYIN